MDGKEKVERWLDGFSVFIKPEDLCCFTSELKVMSVTSSEMPTRLTAAQLYRRILIKV